MRNTLTPMPLLALFVLFAELSSGMFTHLQLFALRGTFFT